LSRALWRDFRKSPILSLELVLLVVVLLLSLSDVGDWGACASKSDNTLWAVEVSPDFSALSIVSSAVPNGSEELKELETPLILDVPVSDGGGGGGGFEERLL